MNKKRVLEIINERKKRIYTKYYYYGDPVQRINELIILEKIIKREK